MDPRRLAAFVLLLVGVGTFAVPHAAFAASPAAAAQKEKLRAPIAREHLVQSLRRVITGRIDALRSEAKLQSRKLKPSERAEAKRRLQAQIELAENYLPIIDEAQKAEGADAVDAFANGLIKHRGNAQEAHFDVMVLRNMASELRRRVANRDYQEQESDPKGTGAWVAAAAEAKQSLVHLRVLENRLEALADAKKGPAQVRAIASALQKPVEQARAAMNEKVGFIAPRKLAAKVKEGLAAAKAKLAADDQDGRRLLNQRAKGVLAQPLAKLAEQRAMRAAKRDKIVEWMTLALERGQLDHLERTVMLAADDHGARATQAMIKRALGVAVSKSAARTGRTALNRAKDEVQMRELAAGVNASMDARAAQEGARLID